MVWFLELTCIDFSLSALWNLLLVHPGVESVVDVVTMGLLKVIEVLNMCDMLGADGH